MAVKYAKDQPSGFTNRIERVAVVGGGGQMGRHLTEHLLKTGQHTVTAITRPGSTSTFPDGVNVVRVDYADERNTAVVEALRGQQVLIVTMSISAPRDATTLLIRAAAAAGVPYILPNWFGHDPANDSLRDDSMLTAMRDALCNEVTSLGVSAYLLLACSFWYEFSLGGGPDRFGFDFKARSLTLFDGGDVFIHTSTWPQCGRAVANLLSLPELPHEEADATLTLARFCHRPVYVSSFRVSQMDMFASVKRVTGTADEDWSIAHESAEERWREATGEIQRGNWGAFTKMLYSRMFFPGKDNDYQTDNALLGLPAEDLDAATAIAVRMGKTEEIAREH